MNTNWKLYKIQGENYLYETTFLGEWYTENYTNTITARFIRIKLGHIWLELLKSKAACVMINSQSYDKLNTFYTFEITERRNIDYLIYDQYVDFNRFKDSDLSSNLAKEYLPFLYASFRYFGAFKFTLECDPTRDYEAFSGYIARPYTSQINFNIDINGNYNLIIEHSLDHKITNDSHIAGLVLKELKQQDLSFNKKYIDSGNINEWVSITSQVKETIHEQYRNKSKKSIPVS
jgi:hypothetical protein